MDEEIESFLNHLEGKEEIVWKEFKFYTGKLFDKEVIIVKSGAGKVFASMICQRLIDKYNVDKILFTGVAGALNPDLDIGDVVIGTDSVHHDMDAIALGFERGQIPFTDYKFFKADEKLVGFALETNMSPNKIMKGKILTGDQFMTQGTKKDKDYLVNDFEGDCIEMEGAAVAQVCTINKIPHLIIRTISDRSSGDAVADFNTFASVVASNSLKVVEKIFDGLEPHFSDIENIKNSIRTIPDFPKPGVMYRDITTLLANTEAMKKTIDILCNRYKDKKIDAVAGIESRGFIFAAILAEKLNLPLIPIRKPGKLPGEIISQEYELEYGTDKVEVHKDAIKTGQNVLLIDDLVATSGTALASCYLIEKLGGKVEECAFIIELDDLGGRKKIEDKGHKIFSIINFGGE